MHRKYKKKLPNVILGLIMDASFFKSAKAAKGSPQFATFYELSLRNIFQLKFYKKNIYVVPKNAVVPVFDEIKVLKINQFQNIFKII
jgi:hypothetical protein